jgi:tRNA dimethylallyltransferase
VTTDFVLAIFGPTASGKTAVAEALTERIPAEIVSADSMQVYRGVPILTAQPEKPTRLVEIWDLDHEASVGEYQRLAHEAIDEVLAMCKTPIVAGGSGLYLRAALSDIEIPPLVLRGEREEWERLYDRLGPEAAHRLLLERDPEAAARVHPNDRRRVVRALELHSSGSSLAPDRDELWSEETRHPTLVFGLDLLREALVERIKARARAMLERGVEEEVRRALERPISVTARQMHGLEVIATRSREEAFDELVRLTRSYAHYQRKWMRRIPGLVSLPANRPPGEIADAILEVARARQRLPAGRAG